MYVIFSHAISMHFVVNSSLKVASSEMAHGLFFFIEEHFGLYIEFFWHAQSDNLNCHVRQPQGARAT